MSDSAQGPCSEILAASNNQLAKILGSLRHVMLVELNLSAPTAMRIEPEGHCRSADRLA